MLNTIVITNVDSLLGYAIAYKFVSDWNRQSTGAVTEFRLLCHERQGLQELEKLGGKIIEMQKFDDEKEMSHIMKNVDYVIYVPEYSNDRIQEGELVIRTAKQEGVGYLTMLSYLGLENLKKSASNNLHQFHKLEKKVSEHFDDDSYCIIRTALFNQFFFYFGPMIDDENEIRLPVDKKSRWGTIDLSDLAEAVYLLSEPTTDDKQQQQQQEAKKENQTLFRLTPRDNYTAQDLVEYASKGLELEENMTYKKIDSEKMYNYLHRIHQDNRFRERPVFLFDQQQDPASTFPLGRYLNDNFIQTIIEYWELANHDGLDITCKDLENILGRHPYHLKKFFEMNRDQFRRLR
ncbi:hypothetical protein BD770DRAFT_373281 [Pilaira anomala]|nr:hypothetical protein BD770DRAFT_373281 [Pilaira anomala]